MASGASAYLSKPLPAQATHRGGEQALPYGPTDRPRPGTPHLTGSRIGVSGPASCGVRSGFQLRRSLPFLAVLRVTHVSQQCTFGISGMLSEVPQQCESGLLVGGHVTEDLAG
jgi:hypothetical protein